MPPNGCSGGQSVFWRLLAGRGPKWEYCCDEHDLVYEQGGPEEWRKWADVNLRDCMLNSSTWLTAWIYYVAVRLFGGAHWNKGDK